MRLLDLYCGAGGAAMGYHRAGFEVVGVDIAPQKHYPFEFHQSDALDFLSRHGRSFDAIHASPPCQAHIAITQGTNRGRRYPALIVPTRGLLARSGSPYVIECGQGPHIRRDVLLCGEMFDLPVIRHRDIELGHWSMQQPVHRAHRGRVRGWRHGKYYEGPYLAVYGKGGGKATAQESADALGIDWTTDDVALREAIPPVYTEHIGRQLMEHLS